MIRSAHALIARRILLLAPLCAVACSTPRERVRVEGYVPATEESLRAAGWHTDLAHREVPISAIRKGPLARDAFPVISAPAHGRASELGLDAHEPVLVVRGDTEVRAWPLAALLDTELVLDEVDGVPVAATFCSLCGSALVWSRLVDGRELELGVSGLLLDGNSLLYDRETDSLWRQLDGRAVAGRRAGMSLTPVPSFVVSLGALREARPNAIVMKMPVPRQSAPVRHLTTGDIGRNEPPAWLEIACSRPFDRGLAVGGAGPLPLGTDLVRNADDFVVFEDPQCGSAYGAEDPSDGPRVSGAGVAFERAVDGRRLTFEADGGGIFDRETGTRWNLLGEAVAGPLAGARLTLPPQVAAFRFAWE